MPAKPLKRIISIAAVSTLMAARCSAPDTALEASTPAQPLPYLGEHDVQLNRKADGTVYPDTVYYTIPKFSFTNQQGSEVSHHQYEGKIFVADFFFTTCNSICPVMSSQMARLQARVKNEGLENEVMFLSHTVKPEEDTPEVLMNYANSIGADLTSWHFVTGNADDIYDLAQQGYMLTAFPSDTAQGGVFHTDKFTLVDNEMHIRGYYDGTSTQSVDQLFDDLKTLLQETHDHKHTAGY
ncbi:MAG: SCO family protein [Flavobacteriales bacterium]